MNKHICGSPRKSNIIPSRILSASLSLMRYSAKLPLETGLIRASSDIHAFYIAHMSVKNVYLIVQVNVLL